MNLQNLKNYLIFLVAVSHMLAFGYESGPQETKEKPGSKPLIPMSVHHSRDSTLTVNPVSGYVQEGNVFKMGNPETGREKALAPKVFHIPPHTVPPCFFIDDPYKKNFTSNLVKMKSFSIVSAPIRYLAYANVLVMILCIVLEPNIIPLEEHQPKAKEILSQYSEKEETNPKLFLNQEIKHLHEKAPIAAKFWKIRLDTTFFICQDR
ncbi:hypothetical protein [Catalinimonas niigatensis]|uniref:hypothetical protein n=1 Tax=Catalinimonas niigatensis TaxID=1397264 RepID=UPI0026671C10|nr:hypothetical protein [Catalinimonas niigatensis]WPP50409.1 hypothetical protein PZB72_27460 [Catalinimonas niigatensis]